MIIVSRWIQLDPAKVAEALTAAEPFIRPVREWDGCLDYAWNADGIEPGRVYVYERWADEASFAAHLAGENYRNMRAHMGQYGAPGGRGTQVPHRSGRTGLRRDRDRAGRLLHGSRRLREGRRRFVPQEEAAQLLV